jgi:hypothetical protein
MNFIIKENIKMNSNDNFSNFISHNNIEKKNVHLRIAKEASSDVVESLIHFSSRHREKGEARAGKKGRV